MEYEKVMNEELHSKIDPLEKEKKNLEGMGGGGIKNL